MNRYKNLRLKLEINNIPLQCFARLYRNTHHSQAFLVFKMIYLAGCNYQSLL